MGALILHTRVVSGSGGGPDKTILNSPGFLRDKGYPMVCAYMRHPDDEGFRELERRAREKDVCLEGVDDAGPLDWRIIGRFRRLCEKYRPAIWHAHDYKSNLLGLVLRRSFPMRLVTTVHGWAELNVKTRLYFAIDNYYCLRRYDAVVCVSEDIYALMERYRVPEGARWYVPNAIDTEEYRRTRSVEEAKLEAGVSPETFLVGAVGRLSDEKGFHILIRAVHELRKDGFPVELRIAGDGPERPRLERLIGELDLGSSVHLLGHVPSPIEFFEAMDVFVLSSLREGLPNVVLEALSLEVPVLSTKIPAVSKVITHGENGFLVDADSVSALAEGLAALIRDPKRRGALARAGRITVVSAFGFARRMEKIKEVYDRTLNVDGAAHDQ